MESPSGHSVRELENPLADERVCKFGHLTESTKTIISPKKFIMKILSWNVNGYRAVCKKGFADWLAKEKPDILCLQETKAWAEQLTREQLNPVRYETYFSKPVRKGYSGVATFSKNRIEVHSSGFGIDSFDSEGRILITKHEDIILANIYFPNGKSKKERLIYKMDFYEATLKYFGKMLSEGKKIIVTGDYNTAHKEIDLEHPKPNARTSGFLPEEREWIDNWIKSGFTDIFREFNDQPQQYTWWDMRTRARDRNVGWRIDYFFVSENLVSQVKNAWILKDVAGSDHCPIAIEL